MATQYSESGTNYTQEIRLSAPDDKAPFQWLVGGFYFNGDNTFDLKGLYDAYLYGYTPAPGLMTVEDPYYTLLTTRTWAGFCQMGYTFRDKLTLDSLYRMLIAPVRARLMITGIRLNLFSHLGTPVSAGALAQTLGTHPANTALMLDGLAACDLVFKTRGLYRNTPAAEAFLVQGGSTDLGGLFSAWAHDLDTDTMLGLVKEGPPPADPPGEEVWAEYAPAMANLQQAGIAQRIARIISALPEFSSCSSLLDLGGGPGRIGMAIVAAHPSMTGILFDRPAVARVAERFIEMDGMQARMTAMGGDFIHDSIGKGYDLVWASSVLNAVQRDADRIVRKIYDALNPGGVFVSCHDGLTHERCKPEFMVLGWLPTALAGQDMGLDKGFIADAMARAGFRSVQSSTLDTPMGPMALDTARKG